MSSTNLSLYWHCHIGKLQGTESAKSQLAWKFNLQLSICFDFPFFCFSSLCIPQFGSLLPCQTSYSVPNYYLSLSVCACVPFVVSFPAAGGSVGPTVFNCAMHYQFTLCCLQASFFNLYLEEDDWRWPLINCIIAHPYHVLKHGHC